MPQLDQSQLRSYVNQISRADGGPEAMADLFQPEGLEAAAPQMSGLKAPITPQLSQAVRSATEKLARPGAELDATEMFVTEAIIIPEKRPAFDIVDGDFVADHPLWRDLTTDPAIHRRLCAAIPGVGRIELPGQEMLPYAGTGFVVGPRLLMTNRHVAEIFASGLGVQSLRFRSGWDAAVNFTREEGRPAAPDLKVRRVVMIHPWWDMALLEVPDLDPALAPLRLSVLDARELASRRIAVIGYPAHDPLYNDRAVQDQLFRRRYRVKRLQPGEMTLGQKVRSFDNLVAAATHDCSTLQGNSGSALVDLETGAVLALHFGGRYLGTNYAVPSCELARDSRVVQAGVSLEGTAPDGPAPAWLGTWDRLESEAPAVMAAGSGRTDHRRVTFEVPLRITVELGACVSGVGEAASIPPVPLPEGTGRRPEAAPAPVSDAGGGGHDPVPAVAAAPAVPPARPRPVAERVDGNESRYCACVTVDDLSELDRLRLQGHKAALLNSARWQPGDVISVRFLEGSEALQDRVKAEAKEWMRHANLTFDFRKKGPAFIRIGFRPGNGSWSYVGTMCRQVPEPKPTMNYGWLTEETPKDELRRVVLHEFGHAIGMIHEHQNPKGGIRWNRDAVLRDLSGPPNHWSMGTIETNIFKKYMRTDVVASDVDSRSIMMYPIPRAWTENGYFCADLNAGLSPVDKQFVEENYPR